MLTFLLSTAVRSLKRNRLFSIINIFGLAVAIACTVLIGLFIADELSFDRQNPDAENIYRVVSDVVNTDGTLIPDATTPPGVADHLRESIPEIESVAKLFVMGGQKAYFVRTGRMQFLEPQIIHVDSNFFELFPATFVKGSPGTALKDPWTVVLTETAARKYLGSVNSVGQTIQIDDWEPCRVTAIVKDPPTNSHFTYTLLARRGNPDNPKSNWHWFAFHTYIKVKSGADMRAVDRKIQEMVSRNSPEKGRSFTTQPLTSIHLQSNRRNEIRPNGDRSYLFILASIGFFILAIACINYINLSTAQSSLRAKEVGIRKVTGASLSTLRKQFLTESLLMSLFATVLGVGLTVLLLPEVNAMTGKTLSLWSEQQPFTLLIILAFGILIGAISGLYPAFYLSSLRPASVLKGTVSTGRGAMLRKSLVVTQFALAIILMVGTFVLKQQVTFAQDVKLGLNKDNVVQLQYSWTIPLEETSILKESLLKIPGVIKVSAVNGSLPGHTWAYELRKAENSEKHTIHSIGIDTDYLACMNIPIKEGTNFLTETRDTGDRDIIMNEQAVVQLGVPDPVIGRKIVWDLNRETGQNIHARIIGVVKNFHFSSMKNEIEPFVFVKRGIARSDMAVRIEGGHTASILAAMEKVWNSQVHSWPFSFEFMSADFDRLYDSEKRYTRLFAVGCLIALFVSCLGLFGLSTFMIGQRRKEIGVRKVLGGSEIGIAGKLASDFTKLVIISAVVSFPVAAIIMQRWLNGYAYRTTLHWWTFLSALLISLGIALFTVGLQALRAARANPIDALRSE